MHALQNKKMGETPILETPSNSGAESVQLTKSP
jgi:hypothetical protein